MFYQLSSLDQVMLCQEVQQNQAFHPNSSSSHQLQPDKSSHLWLFWNLNVCVFLLEEMVLALSQNCLLDLPITQVFFEAAMLSSVPPMRYIVCWSTATMEWECIENGNSMPLIVGWFNETSSVVFLSGSSVWRPLPPVIHNVSWLIWTLEALILTSNNGQDSLYFGRTIWHFCGLSE